MKSIPIYLINRVIAFFEGVSSYCNLMRDIFRSYKSWNYYIKLSNIHMYQIGIRSLPIVMVTGLFSGMVLAVQAAYQVDTATIPGMEWTVASVVGEAILLELAPMITALVMTGKIGATIAAEIGTMRVTEQIDALESLSFDPVAYLIFPRVFAGMIMFPILIAVADFFGLIGGMWVTTNTLDLSAADFMRGLRTWFQPMDYWFGIIKGFFFGLAITSIACFYGFYTKGGAKGVGETTTTTVVVSCITIVFLDYILGRIILL